MALLQKFSSFNKAAKRRIFDHRVIISHSPKSLFFTCIIFSSISVFIFLDSILSNILLHSSHSKNIDFFTTRKTNNKAKQTFDIDRTTLLLSTQDKVDNDLVVESELEETNDPLVPPEHVSRQERIAWFRRKLPELHILNSNSLSKQFHRRVLEFLSGGCSVQFYMVWLFPAKSFGKRNLLSVESLFKAHRQGCLIILSNSLDSNRGYRILKPLLDWGFRILTVSPDLPFLVNNTPAEAWLKELKSGTKDPGAIPLSQNLSNLMRLTILYKYGGIYIDSDIIVLRDFSKLRNVVGAQSIDAVSKQWTRLNGAVMVFDIYHPLLLDFLAEFALTFDGNIWGFNGPYLLSRVITRIIRSKSNGYHDFNFTIFPPKAFYPVHWHRIERVLKKPKNETELRWVEQMVSELNGRDTYAIHLWMKRSGDCKIEEGSVVARLILDHCLICNNL
ncbi:hypothetical protein UlMin_000492 [Ulmus minor]